MTPEDFDLEQELRQALRRTEPDRDFSGPFMRERAAWWRRPGYLALAAALVLGLMIPAGVMEYGNRQKRREAARDQVITALRIAGSKVQRSRQIVIRQLNRREAL